MEVALREIKSSLKDGDKEASFPQLLENLATLAKKDLKTTTNHYTKPLETWDKDKYSSPDRAIHGLLNAIEAGMPPKHESLPLLKEVKSEIEQRFDSQSEHRHSPK